MKVNHTLNQMLIQCIPAACALRYHSDVIAVASVKTSSCVFLCDFHGYIWVHGNKQKMATHYECHSTENNKSSNITH